MAKRILIADDSVTIQRAFAMTFGSEDVTLTLARSADEGLALAQRNPPDLIIADGVMPGRTGYDLCTQVRSDPGLRSVPVYILASSQQPYDEAKGRRAGADGHLLKPWDTTVFIQQVTEALGRGSAGASRSPAVAAAPTRPSAVSLPGSAIEDDYGEISIDRGADTVTPPPLGSSLGRAPSAPSLSGPPAMAAAPAAMRPSLIPGMRPGGVAPARPGTAPVRPLGGIGGLPASAPPRPAMPPATRTMIGLPAANVPIPGAMRPVAPAPTQPAPSVPQRPRVATPAPAAAERPRLTTPPPPAAAPPGAPSYRPRVATPPPGMALATPPAVLAPPVARSASPSPASAAIAASVDQKLALIASKGAEYEAIAKLSREIIEQVVWEVVPELAEAIIREQLAKRNV